MSRLSSLPTTLCAGCRRYYSNDGKHRMIFLGGRRGIGVLGVSYHFFLLAVMITGLQSY